MQRENSAYDAFTEMEKPELLAVAQDASNPAKERAAALQAILEFHDSADHDACRYIIEELQKVHQPGEWRDHLVALTIHADFFDDDEAKRCSNCC